MIRTPEEVFATSMLLVLLMTALGALWIYSLRQKRRWVLWLPALGLFSIHWFFNNLLFHGGVYVWVRYLWCAVLVVVSLSVLWKSTQPPRDGQGKPRDVFDDE